MRSQPKPERRRPSRAARRARALAAGLAALVTASAGQAIGAGEPAPQFRAPALGGGGAQALTDFRGKVVYLDFWASWCPPCLNSLPELETLRKEFPSDQFQVLAVNVDRDPEQARAFLEKRPVGYPSVSDPEGRLPEKFAIETMPTSFLIDGRGVVRYVHEGFRKGDVEGLRAEIRKLVAAEAARR
jgi:thiol-disulfide isomerase/thioredoxin